MSSHLKGAEILFLLARVDGRGTPVVPFQPAPAERQGPEGLVDMREQLLRPVRPQRNVWQVK
eukprot:2022940-Prorocentrum_lima.AAC.1